MKRIELNREELEHFKGADSVAVEFSPGQTDIYGDNATGKSTLFDAITWLLFGKDSRNQAQFSIKPLGTDGHVKDHGVRSTVRAELTVDGVPVTLEKSYAEKWTKKRGAAMATCTGHEQTCSIDGVPKKIGEFNSYIKSLISEDTFRVLTSPDYFAGTLDWRKRREVLMELCGDIDDADVIASLPAGQQADLEAVLARHGVNDAVKVLKARRTKLNRELAELPVRIDEAMKTIGPEADTAALEMQIADQREQAAVIQSRISVLGTDTGQRERLAELQTRINELKQADDDVRRQAYAQYMEQHRAWTADERESRTAMERCERDALQILDSIEVRSRKADELRAEWREVSAQTWTDETVCPTCGQELPAEQVDAKREAFNLRKSERLEQITSEGKALTECIPDMRREWTALKAEAARLRKELKNLTENEPQPPVPSEGGSAPEIDRLKAEMERVRSEPNADAHEIAKLKERLAGHQGTIRELYAQLAQAEAAQKTRERIEELKTQEKLVAREIETVDRQLAALEDFTRARVRIVEERVNGQFRTARFKLFDEQVNGGLAECCELTVDGVPWADLNSAMRINAGLDVINTLSRHYGVSAPVFVDNAESVVNLEPVDGQLIRLIVSEPDKTLRVQEVA